MFTLRASWLSLGIFVIVVSHAPEIRFLKLSSQRELEFLSPLIHLIVLFLLFQYSHPNALCENFVVVLTRSFSKDRRQPDRAPFQNQKNVWVSPIKASYKLAELEDISTQSAAFVFPLSFVKWHRTRHTISLTHLQRHL
jgi:hypothetical protein